jgi:hypothetical protein
VVHSYFGAVKGGYRLPPGWIGHVSHPLIAFLVLPATLLWRRRRGLAPASDDVLLLLALLFLARCVLDAANNSYYHLPFLVVLATWEALTRERPPLLALGATALVWWTVVQLPHTISPDAQCLIYLTWAVPALATMAGAVYRWPHGVRRRSSTRATVVAGPGAATTPAP